MPSSSGNTSPPIIIPPRVLKWTESLSIRPPGLPVGNLKTSPYVRSLPPGLGLATISDQPSPVPSHSGDPASGGNPGCKRSNSSSAQNHVLKHGQNDKNTNFLATLKRRMSFKMAGPPRPLGAPDRYGCNYNTPLNFLAPPPPSSSGATAAGCCRECGCPFPPPPRQGGHVISHPHASSSTLIDQVSRLFRADPRHHSRQNSYSSCSFSSSGYSSSSNFSLYPLQPTTRAPQAEAQPGSLLAEAIEPKEPILLDSFRTQVVSCSGAKTSDAIPDINTHHDEKGDHEISESSENIENTLVAQHPQAIGVEEGKGVRCVDSGICLLDDTSSINPLPICIPSTTTTGCEEIEDPAPSRTTTPSLAGSVCSQEEVEEPPRPHPVNNYDGKCEGACPCMCHELYAYGLLSQVELEPARGDDNVTAEHVPSRQEEENPRADPDAITLVRHQVTPSSTATTSPPPSSLTSSVLASINRRLNCKLASGTSNLPTSRLILENRPKHLPPKQPEEELKHKFLYNAMIEAAKKKEVKETKVKRKLLVQKLKAEERLAQMAKIWNTEIIPNWEVMRGHKKTRALMSAGLPPSVRGKVWCLAIGNDLNITNDLYDICVARSKERMATNSEPDPQQPHHQASCSVGGNYEESLRLIQLDVSRTFPNLCIFQQGAPYHELLHDLLSAYVSYRPDVGYVQGMSFIAAVLLLNMEVKRAFICFANLLNGPCFQAFFRMDQCAMGQYFDTYRKHFRFNLPKLYDHFERLNFNPDLYLTDWIYTIYSKSLHLDVACRLWDVFLRDGQEFLFRTALGILKLYEDILLKMDFMQLAEYLTKLEDPISADTLFDRIATIDMTMSVSGAEKKGLSQLLTNASPRSLVNSPIT